MIEQPLPANNRPYLLKDHEHVYSRATGIMADLDADILALAGETSDEAESPAPSAVAVPPESPNATASHVPAEEKKGEASPKSPVSKKRDLVSTTDEAERMSKKARRDESEEEGEACVCP